MHNTLDYLSRCRNERLCQQQSCKVYAGRTTCSARITVGCSMFYMKLGVVIYNVVAFALSVRKGVSTDVLFMSRRIVNVQAALAG